MQKAKTIIGVVVIFAMGALCGALGDHIVYKMKIKKYVSGDRNFYQEIIVKDLNKKLDLDAVQREKVNEIVKNMFIEMQVIRRQSLPQIEAIVEKQRSEVRTLLRPDQMKAYEEVIAYQKAKALKKYRHEK